MFSFLKNFSVRRLSTLLAVFLAGAIVAGGVSWKLDLWPSASAARQQNPHYCGEILVSGFTWLDGNGVDVHSNGDWQGTGTSCANDDQQVYDLNASPPIYGYGWQCVELVNRLYATNGWFPKLWLGNDTNHGAKWLYTYAEAGKYPGLAAHANGTGYKPVPGDMIVHSSGTYGHVAVVDRIEGGSLYAVEQNNSVTGWATYGYDPASGAVSRSGATIAGYVHAAKNQSVTPAPETDVWLIFTITGECTTAGGVLITESSGFTPGGRYEVRAWYPNDQPYTNLTRYGRVRPDGSVTWRWPCKGDPPGTYRTTVIDLASNRQTGQMAFYIGPAPAPPQPPAVPEPQPTPPVQPAPTTRTSPPARTGSPPATRSTVPPPPPVVPPQPPVPPPPPVEPPPPPEPKPVASNLRVVLYGGGHVGVAFDVAWQPGRDPVACHFFIDGQERFTAQCGTYSSKQFYNISPGEHAFHATVIDRFGVYSDPTPTVVRRTR